MQTDNSISTPQLWGERRIQRKSAFICACANETSPLPSRDLCGERFRKYGWMSLSSPGQGLLLETMKYLNEEEEKKKEC